MDLFLVAESHSFDSWCRAKAQEQAYLYACVDWFRNSRSLQFYDCMFVHYQVGSEIADLLAPKPYW